MSISFDAHQARIMELHKDDIMFGVRERVYAEIMAAAYAGNTGTVIKIPAEYNGYIELELFLRRLIKDGFTLVETDSDDDDKVAFEVYWGIL